MKIVTNQTESARLVWFTVLGYHGLVTVYKISADYGVCKTIIFKFWHQKIKPQSGNFTAMVSAADGGDIGDGGGGGNVNFPSLVRTLAKGAAVTLGGIFSITVISSTTMTLFTLHKKDQFGSPSSSSIKTMNASSCDVCRGKGFYMCKLCKGNATIDWSPLYDPVFINPCLCPTCDGNRIQRCLNCLGSGFIQQAKG